VTGKLGTAEKDPARILMIEDNGADVFILRHALDQHGDAYQLDVLRDGEEALRFIYDQRQAPRDPEPCVIILDLHLPKHDGTTILQALRNEPALIHSGVVVLTSLASPQDEREVLDFGVRLYRTKPSQLDAWISFAGEVLAICREPSSVPIPAGSR
jgi:chemotaxis family two-component system response regulator Rcp1